LWALFKPQFEHFFLSVASAGYIIIATPVTDLRPDAGVRAAMNEINKQLRLKKAASEQGDARKIIEIKAAEAEAERIRIEASADADAKFLSGQGISRQRQALVDGLSASVKNFSTEVKEIDPKEVMEMIIVTQYFGLTCLLASLPASSSIHSIFFVLPGF